MSGQPYPKASQVSTTRKRYRRIVASRKQWEKLRAERLGPCLLCGWLGTPQTLDSTLHHVVPRDALYAGDDLAENLVPLCGTGTTGHHGKVTARDREACQAFAAAVQQLEDAVYAYAVGKLGEEGWLRLHQVRFEAA